MQPAPEQLCGRSMDGQVAGVLGLKCMGDGMTTKKTTHRKVSGAKRGSGGTTKKPGDLKVRRAKGKLIAVRRQVLKNEPWYASAATQIGIKAADQGR